VGIVDVVGVLLDGGQGHAALGGGELLDRDWVLLRNRNWKNGWRSGSQTSLGPVYKVVYGNTCEQGEEQKSYYIIADCTRVKTINVDFPSKKVESALDDLHLFGITIDCFIVDLPHFNSRELKIEKDHDDGDEGIRRAEDVGSLCLDKVNSQTSLLLKGEGMCEGVPVSLVRNDSLAGIGVLPLFIVLVVLAESEIDFGSRSSLLKHPRVVRGSLRILILLV
jgi:hypothetical protein